jgi:hypothetical protein
LAYFHLCALSSQPKQEGFSTNYSHIRTILTHGIFIKIKLAQRIIMKLNRKTAKMKMIVMLFILSGEPSPFSGAVLADSEKF